MSEPKRFLPVPHFKQELDYSCLPACVRMVLAFYGQEYEEARLHALLKTRPGGTSPVQVMLRLPEMGFDAYVRSGSLSLLRELLNVEIPCVVHLWTPPLPYWSVEAIHAVVVVAIAEDRVLVHDPVQETGPTEIPIDTFVEAWAATDYLTIVIRPKETT